MAQSVYDQHRKAFANVMACVVLNAQGEKVATVAIKYGARTVAFTHFVGLPMTRGSAGGGGYDKETAAVYDGFSKASAIEPKATRQEWQEKIGYVELEASAQRDLDAFRQALTARGGSHWHQNLGRNGFTVMQAV